MTDEQRAALANHPPVPDEERVERAAYKMLKEATND